MVAHLVDAVADVLPVVRSFPLVRGMRSFGCPHILNGFVNGKGLSRLFVPCRRPVMQLQKLPVQPPRILPAMPVTVLRAGR